MIEPYSYIVGIEIRNIISRNLKERPLTTILISIGLIVSIIVIISTLSKFKNQRESLRVSDITLSDRIKSLDSVQKSLIELSNFIENQKKDIVIENQILDNLKKEKKELEPLINANKELIDKIFQEQNKRSKWELWLSIFLGFVFGIIASFISSVLHVAYVKYRQGKASA